MANAIKPFLFAYCDGRRCFFLSFYCDGKRQNNTLLFSFIALADVKTSFVIAMANDIKPEFVFYCDGKRYTTNVFLFVAMANAIQPMFFLCIAMANAVTPFVLSFIAMANDMKPMLFYAL